MQITRSSQKFDCTVDTVLADCTEIPMAGWAGGTIVVPNGSSLTEITLYGAHELGGTFYALYDKNGNEADMDVTQNRIYELPSCIYACAAIKIVGSHDETGATVYMKG
jgi:hypothetical protein